MTVGELKRMSPEEKATLYDKLQSKFKPAAINTETDSIDKIIEEYVNSEIPLDDIEDLKKALIAIGV